MGRPRKFRAALKRVVHTLRRFWPQIRRERRLIASSTLALVASVVLQVLEPWPLKFVFDEILLHQSSSSSPKLVVDVSHRAATMLPLAALALVLITALRAVAEYWNRIGFALVGNRVLTEVRNEVYSHLQGLSLSFHNRARSGDLVVRVIGDVTQLREVVVTALLPLLGNVFILIGMSVVMFALEWRLSLLALGILPLFGLTTVHLSQRIHAVARKQRQRQGEMAATATESMAAIKVIQALSLQERFAADFSGQNKKDQKESVKGARLSARLERTIDVLVALGTALVLWYGALLVLRGELTAGSLLVFLTYLRRGFRPAQDFAKYSARLSKAAAAGERVLDLLDRTPEVHDLPHATIAPALRGEICFDAVTFAYEPQHVVLNNLRLDIRAGQRVAIVGPSGIGKSTVLSLLLRLYDPQAGRVLIDGCDIRSFTLASLRQQISIVLQDNLLFAANVWDNIRYGDYDATRDDIQTAAKLANAHDFITALRDGYDTVLGERGATLSHGQRQRIAIARAAIRQTPILILDEPCTGLDQENENAVIQALERLAAARTTLLVTHDLLQASHADEIVYLERGSVVERGTHAELMVTDGYYAAAFRLQSLERTRQCSGNGSHARSS